MRRERQRPGLAMNSPFLTRGEKIRMALMGLVLLIVLGVMLDLRAGFRSARQTPAPGVNVNPLYAVPARTPPPPPEGALPTPPPPEAEPPPLSEDQEISYQIIRDEVLEAFEDLSPIKRDGAWWSLAARVRTFGYPVLSRLTPSGPNLDRCIQEPDMCRGDVIRFSGKTVAVTPIRPPAGIVGASDIQSARVQVELSSGPREVVIDIPADALPSPRSEETALAGIFIGFLPSAEVPADPAKGVPYFVGLPAGSAPASPPAGSPPPEAPATLATPPAPPPTPLPTPPPPATAVHSTVVRYEGMLDRIQHDGKFEQDEAYNYFIRFINTTDPAVLAARADRNVSAATLIADPRARSGDILRVRGTLLDVYHQGLSTNPANLRDSYVAYVLDREENVTVVHLLEMPPPYRVREDLFEADGIFLKLIHYETQKTTKDLGYRLVRKAPLVLARSGRIRPLLTPAETSLDSVRFLLAFSVVLVLIAGAAYAWTRRNERTARDLIAEARRQKGTVPRLSPRNAPNPDPQPTEATAPQTGRGETPAAPSPASGESTS